MKFFNIFSTLTIWGCLWVHSFAEDAACTSAIRQANGMVDVAATVYNCANNIQGSMYPPSYFNANGTNNFHPTVVNISTSINTLINVDDVNAQVTFDMYFRIYWTDPRWNLPLDMWDSMNPVIKNYEGLELTPYVRAQNQLQIWLPDIQVMEAVQVNSAAELIHLFQNGSVFWSRHLLITVTQAQMDLHQYPNDNQVIELSLQSFAYSDDLLILAPIAANGFIGFNSIPSRPDTAALSLNRLWTYDTCTATVIEDTASIFFHPHRRFSTVLLQLRFTRQNFGILLRLVLPIVIFMTVVAFTFWADLSKRIDVSVQMLLVVSSLYFVIGQFIPFVGYFTIFDKFVTIFFGVLGITIGIHFITYQLDNIKEEYPMALVVKEGLVLAGRICALPIFYYIVYIFFPTNLIYFVIPVCITLGIVILQGTFSFPDFLRSIYFCVCKLRYMHTLRMLVAQEEKAAEETKQRLESIDTSHVNNPAAPTTQSQSHPPSLPTRAPSTWSTDSNEGMTMHLSSPSSSPTATTNLREIKQPPILSQSSTLSHHTTSYNNHSHNNYTHNNSNPYNHVHNNSDRIQQPVNNMNQLIGTNTLLLEQMIHIWMEANQALEHSLQQYFPPPINNLPVIRNGYEATVLPIPNRVFTRSYQPLNNTTPSTSMYVPNQGREPIPSPSISSSFRDSTSPSYPSNSQPSHSHSLSMYSFSKYINNPPIQNDFNDHKFSQHDSQFTLPRVASNDSADSAPMITQQPSKDVHQPLIHNIPIPQRLLQEDQMNHTRRRPKRLRKKTSVRDIHSQSMGIPDDAMLSDEEIQEKLLVQFDHSLFGRAMELRFLYLLQGMECCYYHQQYPVSLTNPFACGSYCFPSNAKEKRDNALQVDVEEDTESPKYSHSGGNEDFPTLDFVEYESSKHQDESSIPSRERLSPHASVSRPLHVFYHNSPAHLPDFPASYSRNAARNAYAAPSISPSKSHQLHSKRYSSSNDLSKSASRDSHDDMLMYDKNRLSLNRNSLNLEQFQQHGLHHLPDQRSWGTQPVQPYQPITISESRNSDKDIPKTKLMNNRHSLDADGFVLDTIQQEE